MSDHETVWEKGRPIDLVGRRPGRPPSGQARLTDVALPHGGTVARVVVAIAVLFVVVFAGGLLVIQLVTVSDGEWFPAGTVDEVRSAGVVWVPSANAFVVAGGDGFRGLSARNPHLGHRIEFCERSQWFEDPAHGEKFSRDGHYRAGPAQRGMDPVATKIEDGLVLVSPLVLREGPSRDDHGPPQGPEGPYCDSPPTSHSRAARSSSGA